MIGAIIGDIIGSVYELPGLKGKPGIKTKDFDLWPEGSQFTDDTVLTVAVAYTMLNDLDLVEVFHECGWNYPKCGFGGRFAEWVMMGTKEPYGSWGNGSAMRVSPIGFAYDTEEEVLRRAEASAAVTHNHPEGVKGAQSVALAIFMARKGADKMEIKKTIETKFGYDLSRTLADIRPEYRFDCSCAGSVPESIISFLEASDFEDAIRNAVSLGGDTDTMACVAGAISQAFWEVPGDLREKALGYLNDPMREVIVAFEDRYGLSIQKDEPPSMFDTEE